MAKRYMQKCSYADARKFFPDRKKEDIQALKHSGCDYIHLDFADAAWRKSSLFHKYPLLRSFLSYIPTLAHVYPNEKKEFSGRLSNDDYGLKRTIKKKLEMLIPKSSKTLLFAPLGVGGHADHVLLQETAQAIGITTIYWEDFPYNISRQAVKTALNKKPFHLKFKIFDNISRKQTLIKFYTSQIPALFPSSNIPVVTEKYYTIL